MQIKGRDTSGPPQLVLTTHASHWNPVNTRRVVSLIVYNSVFNVVSLVISIVCKF